MTIQLANLPGYTGNRDCQHCSQNIEADDTLTVLFSAQVPPNQLPADADQWRQVHERCACQPTFRGWRIVGSY